MNGELIPGSNYFWRGELRKILWAGPKLGSSARPCYVTGRGSPALSLSPWQALDIPYVLSGLHNTYYTTRAALGCPW